MHKFYVLLIHLFRAHGALLYANLGDNVTLPCFYGSSDKQMCWYRQIAGEQPQIISSFYTSSKSRGTLYNHFQSDKRFLVHTGAGFYNLSISNVKDTDSAVYYCAEIKVKVTQFDNGIFLVFKGSAHTSLLQQPEPNSVQPGGSVTLNCSLHAGTSDGEHRVYWFKKDPHLGLMYIHSHDSGQCVRPAEHGSSAQSCVYSLSKRNMSLSDAGVYYCAVALCGDILFGRGVSVDVGEKRHVSPLVSLWGVVVALCVSLLVNVFFICILCKLASGTNLQSAGSHPQSLPEYTTDTQNEEVDALQYVALDFKKRQHRNQRERGTEIDALYSRVRRSGPE